MRAAFHIAGLSILRTWRERTFVILMTCLALFFSAIAGLLFRDATGPSTVPVAFTDLDGSPLSRSLADALEESAMYEVVLCEEEAVLDAVRTGRVEVGFIVPQGFQEALFGESLPVQVVSLSTSNTGMALAKVLERRITEHLLSEAAAAEALRVSRDLGFHVSTQDVQESVLSDFRGNPHLVTELQAVTGAKVKDIFDAGRFSVGFYLMFSMFTVVLASGDILKERRDGTWYRLLSMPTSHWAIALGKVMGTFSVGAVQVGILLAAGRYLFRVDYGPKPLGLVAVLFFYLLAVTGLGLMLSTFVRTPAQLDAISPIIIVSTSMLGGCYWPLEIVPSTMRMLAKLTPQAWAIAARSDPSFSSILPLFLFSCLFFAVGAVRTKFE